MRAILFSLILISLFGTPNLEAQNIISSSGGVLLQTRGTMIINSRGKVSGRLYLNRVTNSQGRELGRIVDCMIFAGDGRLVGYIFDNVITDPAGFAYLHIINGRLETESGYHIANSYGMHPREIALWYFFIYIYSDFAFRR